MGTDDTSGRAVKVALGAVEGASLPEGVASNAVLGLNSARRRVDVNFSMANAKLACRAYESS